VARPDDDLQRYFSDLPFKVKKKLAQTIKDEADKLASAIKAAAPRGATGNLAASVQVRRKKSETELEVTAGGDLTTKEIRKGSGETYDYARAIEFGGVNAPAEPFFFNTYREMAPDIRQNIDDAVADAFNS
jgi:HK97 gp10 family phage protein